MKKIFLLIILVMLMAVNSHATETCKANWAWGTLSSEILDAYGNGDTFTVANGTNAGTFCTGGDGGPFLVTVFDSTCSNAQTCATREIILITGRSGNTFTISARNQESTTHSGDWDVGDKIQQVITAGVFDEYAPALPDQAAASGKFLKSTGTEGSETWDTPSSPAITTFAGAPTPNDDTDLGYTVGWLWLDSTNGAAYIVTDVTDGAAVWRRQNTPRGTAGQICVSAGTGADCALTDTLPIIKFGNGATGGGYLQLMEDTDNGTDYVKIKGSDDSGTNPAFTISGSPANTEDFSVTLGANNNTVTFGSSTGVTELSIGALNLATTGTISGAIPSTTDSNGMTITAAQAYGYMHWATGAGTWNLPAAVAGMSLCVYSTTAAAIVINPDDSDEICYDGVCDTAGHQISGGVAAGDFICFIAIDAVEWHSMGRRGTWTAGS